VRSAVAAAVAAIRGGGVAVVPTDTVYGLACDPADEAAVRRLYALKGRGERQPTAIVGRDVDALLVVLPELRGPDESVLRALLPGPYTLVVPNPAGRLPWLTGGRAGAIGVRVPRLEGAGRAVLDAVGVVAATSANLTGGPDPRRLADVPGAIREGAVIVDGGRLPGTPSTVVDLTGPDPVVIREGAVPAAEAVRRISRVRARTA
jgi:L-threonylcarbamoyladenylate synthase